MIMITVSNNTSHLDNLTINLVQLCGESALLPKDAEFAVSSFWSGTNMSVNAFDLITLTAMHAWCHTCNQTKRLKLLCSWFVGVIMRAGVAVQTILAEVVHVAHLSN